MKVARYVYGAVVLATLLVAVGIWNPFPEQAKAARPSVPRFVVDPFYPKPLPDKWVTGEVAGTCVDSNDHIFIVTRGFQTGGLVSPETVVAKASPPVIEFDTHGNVVNAWGNPAIVPPGQPHAGQNAVLPNGIHGCHVDYEDNVWIAGNGDGVVQKWSHDGSTLLLQIGTKFVCDWPANGNTCGNSGADPTANQSHTLLNQPATVAVDPEPDPGTHQRGSVYIADGYGNHRIVVFDRNGNYLRQWGSVGTGPGQFASADGGHPHCVTLGKDGLVYTCDRGQDRIQVFTKLGVLVRVIPVVPCTGNAATAAPCPGNPAKTVLGTAGSAWDVAFSPDKGQKFMYDADGGNEALWIFDRASALAGVWPGSIIGGFGRPGHGAGEFTFLHTLITDSKGNLYTGETINGRRLQRFKPEGSVPENQLAILNPNASPDLKLTHYDPVKK